MELVWLIMKDAITQSLDIIWLLALVIFLLLVGIELLREYGLMQRLTSKLGGVAYAMGIPDEGMLGVVVGLLGGLSYGSSIMYDTTSTLNLNTVQLNTIFILVGICHSMIEETVIYAATGANGLVILGSRCVFGVLSIVIYRWIAIKIKRGITTL